MAATSASAEARAEARMIDSIFNYQEKRQAKVSNKLLVVRKSTLHVRRYARPSKSLKRSCGVILLAGGNSQSTCDDEPTRRRAAENHLHSATCDSDCNSDATVRPLESLSFESPSFESPSLKSLAHAHESVRQ